MGYREGVAQSLLTKKRQRERDDGKKKSFFFWGVFFFPFLLSLATKVTKKRENMQKKKKKKKKLKNIVSDRAGCCNCTFFWPQRSFRFMAKVVSGSVIAVIKNITTEYLFTSGPISRLWKGDMSF